MDQDSRAQFAPDDGSSELPTYDDTVLIAMVDGDAQLAAEVVGEFTTALQSATDEMAAALLAGRTNTLIVSAHRLKSSARTVGAMRLGELCDRLEIGAKDASTDRLRGLVSAVTAEIDAVVKHLRALGR